MESVEVLIAGGGPVGLAAAVELGRSGVECLVVEGRPEVSHARPRCKTLNVRTMEHLRRWGLADRLRERAPLQTGWSQDIVFCTTLTGHELSRFRGVLGLVAEDERFPELGQQAPQYVLEELLREVVGEELDACTLALGSRVTGLRQDDDEVVVDVVDAGGATRAVRARYVLGCDGPGSTVRSAVGAAYEGEHALRPNFGMLFEAPELLARLPHGPAVQFWVVNDAAPALMGPIDTDGTWWIIAFGVDPERGRREGEALIAAAVGEDVPVRVLSHDPWTARMQLADRARVGRVLLAGDAAHLNPPFGGHGLNTGIGDAINVGWKLAAVLRGWADEAILSSYEAERRPVQTRVIEAAVQNMTVLSTDLVAADLDAPGAAGDGARARAHAEIQRTKHAEFHALDLVLGIEYDTSPVVAAGRGARLTHRFLPDGRSLYDVLGPGFTLLHGVGASASDPAPFAAAAARAAVPLAVVQVDVELDAPLVLVRPDHHVAWLGPDATGADAVIDRVRGAARP